MSEMIRQGEHHLATDPVQGDPLTDIRLRESISVGGDAVVHVTTTGNSYPTIWAGGKCTVYVVGRAHIYASGEAHVHLIGSGRLELSEKATGTSQGAIMVIANTDSRVYACAQSRVFAYAYAQAYATDETEVKLHGHALVFRPSGMEGKAASYRAGYCVCR